jgi:toxin ParE1/3/4
MIVVFADEAEADLERIGDYIAQDNPRRAFTYVQELRARCERLASLPERFPLIPRYEGSGMRRMSFGEYLVFYRVRADRVVVLHVLHGATDYEKLLFPQV